MKVTVLICTHDRAPLLRRVLESLNRAARPADCSVSIHVVANACSDDTANVLQAYQARTAADDLLPLAWEAEPALGKSRALNRALPGLDGDVVAFVDDDHRVDGAYLVSICEAVRGYPQASMFCGRIKPDWDGTEPGWVHERGRYHVYPLPVPNFDLGPEPCRVTREVAVPGGGNLFVRKAIFDRVGYFVVELGPVGHSLGGGEDSDWVLRALADGAELRYVPGAVQYHFVDAERLRLRYLMKKAFQRSAVTVRFSSAGMRRGVLPPRYMFGKLLRHSARGVLALDQDARRFHLVRAAAALGEISGCLGRPASGAGSGYGMSEGNNAPAPQASGSGGGKDHLAREGRATTE